MKTQVARICSVLPSDEKQHTEVEIKKAPFKYNFFLPPLFFFFSAPYEDVLTLEEVGSNEVKI